MSGFAPITNLSIQAPQGGSGSGTFGSFSQQSTNLDLSSGSYNLNIYKYPMEIGTTEVLNYVVFDIYAPKTAQLSKNQAASVDPNGGARQNTDVANNPNLNAQNSAQSKISVAGTAAVAGLIGAFKEGYSAFRDGGGVIGVGAGALGGGIGAAAVGAAGAAAIKNWITITPALQRVSTSIAMYMPDTLKFQIGHDYKDFSMTRDVFGQAGYSSAIGGGLGDMASALGTGSFFSMGGLEAKAKAFTSAASKNPAIQEVGLDLLSSTGGVGEMASGAMLKGMGLAVNPQQEMMYTGTGNRKFALEFDFHPRSAQEAQTIWNIIQTFKANAAPALNKANAGRYLQVPNQFDIRFFFGSTENPYINRVGSCFLQQIDVDYSGDGEFIAMVDGAPSSIKLALYFAESEILYRDLITQYGY